MPSVMSDESDQDEQFQTRFSDTRQLPLKDQVAEFIRRHIEQNSLLAGDPLPSEVEVVKALGISRTVVREAWNGLVATGAIEASPGRRPRVGRLGAISLSSIFEHALATEQGSVTQVLELRRSIEVDMAGLAALRASPDVIKDMRRTVDLMAHLLSDQTQYAFHDMRLHHLLAEASNNPFHVLLVDGLQAAFQQTMRLGLRSRTSDEQLGRVQELHAEIVEAVAAGDQTAARAAMSRHFDDAIRAVAAGK